MTRRARQKSFGELLREKRLEKDLSLRKFASLVGVSPTYLSQVEQDNVMPPDGRPRQADGGFAWRKLR